MNKEPNEDQGEEKEWPREITIRATIETAKRSLGEDYDEDHEGDDALLNEISESMETIEIESWEELEIPEGYEIMHEDDREQYERWRDSNRSA